MISCRKILDLHLEGMSQRTISASTGHSRNTVASVIHTAKARGIQSLDDTMTDAWLNDFLFPEKQAIEKGYYPVDWEKVHKELQKKNITLKLLHLEYATEAREGKKIPYAYRMTTAMRLFHRCHVFGPLLTANCSTSAIEKST